MATARTRAFRQSDGSIVERVYGAPVNFKDAAGHWQHIDTRLKADGVGLTNTAGPVAVRVPRTLAASGSALKVGAPGSAASIAPLGLQGAGTVHGDSESFRGVAPGVDASFAIRADGAEQSYTLTGADAPGSLDVALRVSAGFDVKATPDGGATIVDQAGKTRYVLSPTFGWVTTDSGSARRIPTTITRHGDGWRVRIDVAAKWIRRALRSGSVTIDPTLTIPTAVQDALLNQGLPTSAGLSNSSGQFAVAGNARSLLQFPLDSVPAGSRILDAKLALHGAPQGTADDANQRSVALHGVLAGWTDGQASWNARTSAANWATPGGDFDPATAATVTNARSGGGWFYWTPTALVQNWVSGTQANNGFEIVGQTLTPTDSTTWFVGAHATGANAANQPYLQVRYAPPAGQRRDDTYLSTTLNSRTQMGVGVASGNLLLSSDDVSINGVGLPLSLTRTYNTGLANFQTGAFGNGGTSNLSGDVRALSLADGGAGIYLGDGSFYRFGPNGSGGFTDAPRLEASLVRHTDGTWTLTYHQSHAVWQFDAAGRLRSMADKNGNTITLAYSTGGVLSSITDTEGRVLAVLTNAAGQITRLTDPSGRQWSYTYGGTTANRLATFTDPEGGVTRYGYDTQNRLTKITTPGGRVTEVQYDADNRVSQYMQIDDPGDDSGPTTTLGYDQADPRCTGDTANHATVVTDPRGHQTTYCVNTKDEVTTTVDPDGHEQATTYTPDGQVQTFTNGTGTGAAITHNGYDTLNNLISTAGPMGEATNFSYQSNPTTQVDKYQPKQSTDPDQHSQFFGYDAQGNVTTVQAGSTTSPALQSTLSYNGDGTIKDATDGENRKTTYGYYAAADGPYLKGLLKTYAPPSPIGATTLTYDQLGRVATAVDGNGKTTGYTYDQLDRVKTIAYTGGSIITYTYDQDGNQTDANDSVNGDYGYTYDLLGRRTGETLPGARSYSYTYDPAGNLQTLTDYYGETTGYGYDAENRNCYVAPGTTGGGDCASPPSGAITMLYDELGNRTKITDPNGTDVETTPDLSGKPTAIALKASGTTLLNEAYAYSSYTGAATGTLVKSETLSPANAAIEYPNRNYYYTSAGQLREAEASAPAQSGGSNARFLTRLYSYDKAGNRLHDAFFPVGAAPPAAEEVSRTYSYNGANQLTSIASTPPGSTTATTQAFSYDAAGNDLRFGYNVRNQTSSFGSATLSYAGPNQAELTDDNGQTIENNLLGVSRRVTAGDPTSFVRASDGTLLARKSPGSVWSYYVLDAQGSVIAITNANGTVTNRDEYDPDGNLYAGSTPIADFGYTGSYTRSGAQTLYHNGLRWYDPSTARWTQPDSLDQPGDLKNAAPYVYAGSDPVNYIDPAGEKVTCSTLGIGGICKTVKKQATKFVTSTYGRVAQIAGACSAGAAAGEEYGASEGFGAEAALTGCLVGVDADQIGVNAQEPYLSGQP